MGLNGSCRILSKWLMLLAVVSGCAEVHRFQFTETSAPSYYKTNVTEIKYPDVQSCLQPQVVETIKPFTLENPADLPAHEMRLQDAIQLGLQNHEIMRSLGASIVQSGLGARTKYDPAITETNPLGGVEAALAAFDAQVTSQLYWQKVDRPNNIAINPILQQFQVNNTKQTLSVFSYEVAKRTATGARFAGRHLINYSRVNTPNQLFPTSFNGQFEAEYRQPFLSGSGVEFNRIAGPGGVVGQYNGVLIARVNTDISLADFELGIVTFVNDIETAYWELYYAYQNLDSQVAGRNSALLTWQRINALLKAGARGGDAASEAQARSQYYLFDAQTKEALAGANGLYAAEQRLRYLTGLPASDGTLLKPISSPMQGEVLIDWNSSLNDALTKRVEIRRQKWTIKRREMELIAARLNKRPQLDFLGQYRYRGLGDNLVGSYNSTNQFNSLYQSIFNGNYQEWQAGLEMSYPVGLRQASAAVGNARFNLARECAVLKEQELRISHDLSNAARQASRSYQLMQTNFNRLNSDREQVEALQARYERGLDNINFLLQAQQQLANSQSACFRSLVDYQLALRDLHREKGSLLNYNQVGLSEGDWPAGAIEDAAHRGQFFAPRSNPSAVEVPNPLSAGSFDPMQVGSNPLGLQPIQTSSQAPPQPQPTISSEADVAPPAPQLTKPADTPKELPKD